MDKLIIFLIWDSHIQHLLLPLALEPSSSCESRRWWWSRQSQLNKIKFTNWNHDWQDYDKGIIIIVIISRNITATVCCNRCWTYWHVCNWSTKSFLKRWLLTNSLVRSWCILRINQEGSNNWTQFNRKHSQAIKIYLCWSCSDLNEFQIVLVKGSKINIESTFNLEVEFTYTLCSL